MRRFWIGGALAVLALCAVGAAAPHATVKNRYLLRLKLTTVAHWKQSFPCPSSSKRITSSNLTKTTVRTKRATPVWLGAVNSDPHNPLPKPPHGFPPLWGGIHGFHRTVEGHTLWIPLRIRTVVDEHTEFCDQPAKNFHTVSKGRSDGDFGPDSRSNPRPMILILADDVYEGYPSARRPRLRAKVNVGRMLAGKTVRFGQKVRARVKLQGGNGIVRLKWRAVIRPAR